MDHCLFRIVEEMRTGPPADGLPWKIGIKLD